MVNSTEFVKTENLNITVDEVTAAKKLEERRVVVTAEAIFEDFPEKTKTDGTVMKATKKLSVPVLFNGKNRLLRLSRTSNTTVVNDMGTGETKEWIGSTWQLGVAGTGMPYISITVISLPIKVTG